MLTVLKSFVKFLLCINKMIIFEYYGIIGNNEKSFFSTQIKVFGDQSPIEAFIFYSLAKTYWNFVNIQLFKWEKQKMPFVPVFI